MTQFQLIPNEDTFTLMAVTPVACTVITKNIPNDEVHLFISEMVKKYGYVVEHKEKSFGNETQIAGS